MKKSFDLTDTEIDLCAMLVKEKIREIRNQLKKNPPVKKDDFLSRVICVAENDYLNIYLKIFNKISNEDEN